VLVDPKLRWNNHTDKVIANVNKWTNLFCRLSSVSKGIAAPKLQQLYLKVAVPRFACAVDIWYKLVPPTINKERRTGSTAINKKLQSIQRRAAITVIGGMRTTAGDT
jgi:hypothetical protein